MSELPWESESFLVSGFDIKDGADWKSWEKQIFKCVLTVFSSTLFPLPALFLTYYFPIFPFVKGETIASDFSDNADV